MFAGVGWLVGVVAAFGSDKLLPGSRTLSQSVIQLDTRHQPGAVVARLVSYCFVVGGVVVVVVIVVENQQRQCQPLLL